MATERALLKKLKDTLNKHGEQFEELLPLKHLIELDRAYRGAELLAKQDEIHLEYMVNGYALNHSEQVIGLKLEGVHLSETYSFLKKFPHLRWLSLANTKISDIACLAALSRLRTLDLHGNYISDISVLATLPRLAQLNLSENYLSDVSTLKGLKHLIRLDVSGSPFAGKNITDLSALEGLLFLTELHAGWNCILDISALKNLQNLHILDLSSNRLSDISILKELHHLTHLDISGNPILGGKVSDLAALESLAELTVFQARCNEISDISPLKNLTKLATLDLSSNHISDIAAMKGLSKLRTLDLSSNQLTDIAPLVRSGELQELHLFSNRISELTALAALPKLRVLNVGSNEIENIAALSVLPHLTHIDLSSNYIIEIAVLKALPKLTELDLSWNHITDISALKTLPGLTSLNLARNHIFDIAALKALPKLHSLSLEWNHISDISVLRTLSNLVQIDLSGNDIADISALRALKKLTHLYLSDNRISKISTLRAFPKLTELDANHNRITDIAVLKTLPELTHVSLNGNHISDVSALNQLQHLEYAEFCSNDIVRIPKEIIGLQHLQHLDLRKNTIRTLSEDLLTSDLDITWAYGWKCCWKDGIFVAGNPLENPPEDIVKQGQEVMQKYFKALEQRRQQGGNDTRQASDGAPGVLKEQQRPLNEVKVVLLGEGAAGKTSLVKRIFKQAFSVYEPLTHGIRITNGKFKSAKTMIRVHFWDFGGQEILHATHQFFLSNRSVYILVLDGRKDEKTEYWLEYIERFGGSSPVFVVLNKIDQHPGFDINRSVLQKRYPNIQGFFRISCATNAGIKVFITHMFKALRRAELFREKWEANWFRVKTRLEKMARHSISYDDYTAICEEEDVTEPADQDTLLEAIHDLGVILYFKDFALQDMQVLSPEWVTNAVYRILDSKEVAESQGILQLQWLDTILRQKKDAEYAYSRQHYRFIIELMKKFELCYELDPEKGLVLIPDLLPVPQPAVKFNYPSSLKFLIGYDFLPRSILPRFIVRRHTDIKAHLCWRNGVVLEDPRLQATAIVRVDYDSQKIFIYVNGEQKRDYFAILRKTFQEIHESFGQLRIDERIGLPDAPGVTVSLEHLLRLERMEQETYIPEGADKPYNVRALLGTFAGEYAREDEQLRILKELRKKTSLIEQITENLSDELQSSLEVFKQEPQQTTAKKGVLRHLLSKQKM